MRYICKQQTQYGQNVRRFQNAARVHDGVSGAQQAFNGATYDADGIWKEIAPNIQIKSTAIAKAPNKHFALSI